MRRDCASTVDRPDRCYRCGEPGHRARDCLTQVLRCPVCADLGLHAFHRMGSLACKPPAQKMTGKQHVGVGVNEGGVKTPASAGPVMQTEVVGWADHGKNGLEEAMETEYS
jgi:hypothetical protein